MPYEIGQAICLWQEIVDFENGVVTVMKEVLVKITETKTGVPGEFSNKPVDMTSLKGVGDDGKEYTKHWDYWPESQTNSFIDQWDCRDDGEGDDKFWFPKEATHAHNDLCRTNKKLEKKMVRVDVNCKPIVPKGDVDHCEQHDYYSHKGGKCFGCLMEKVKAEKEAAQA